MIMYIYLWSTYILAILNWRGFPESANPRGGVGGVYSAIPWKGVPRFCGRKLKSLQPQVIFLIGPLIVPLHLLAPFMT